MTKRMEAERILPETPDLGAEGFLARISPYQVAASAPYIGRNSLLCEWISQRTWFYKNTFLLDEEVPDFFEQALEQLK